LKPPKFEIKAAKNDSDDEFNLENLHELEEALAFNEPPNTKFGNKILDLSPIEERNDEQSTTEQLRPSDINLTSNDLGIDDLLDLPSESMSLSLCSIQQSFVDDFIL
jgi:hypothetical protein